MWLLLLACASDPLAEAGQAYVSDMKPLFAENRALGEQFLQVASKVKKNEVDATAVAAVVSDSAVAAANGMATRAASVHPADSQLVTAHGELITAWKHRAEAYTAVSAAWKAKDTVAFDKAVGAAGKASEEEAAAAEHLSRILLPAGVSIDLYP